MDTAEMMQKIYNAIRAFPNGVKNDQLSDITGIPATDMKEALNSLLSSHQVVIQTVTGTNELIFMAVDEREATLLADLNDDERMVYSHIKASDNRGMWMKDVQRNTNLHLGIITKILKTLEQKNIIKSIKSVKHPSRKMYMLFDLIPSVEITGGAWFTDNELDTEMISALSKVAMKYIGDNCKPRSNSSALLPMSFRYPSARDVLEYLNNKGVLMQDLALSDVQELLSMLVDARQLERVGLDTFRPDPRSSVVISDDHTQQQENLNYKMNWLTEMPCGQCPLFEKCSSIGKITPQTCEYYTQWLSF